MNVAEALIGVIAPPVCVGCNEEGSCLCGNCTLGIDLLPNACYKCGAIAQNGICAKCRKTTRLNGVYSACLYGGMAAKLVRELKYRQNRAAAKDMARIIDERLPDFGTCVITSMPTANSRVRQRSFDHAELLARELARLRQLRYINVLRRVGSERQVGAPKTVRLSQMRGKIRISSPGAVGAKNVILVDDVITTGGSMDEVARVLRNAGVKKVAAVSFAHKKLQ